MHVHIYKKCCGETEQNQRTTKTKKKIIHWVWFEFFFFLSNKIECALPFSKFIILLYYSIKTQDPHARRIPKRDTIYVLYTDVDVHNEFGIQFCSIPMYVQCTHILNICMRCKLYKCRLTNRLFLARTRAKNKNKTQKLRIKNEKKTTTKGKNALWNRKQTAAAAEKSVHTQRKRARQTHTHTYGKMKNDPKNLTGAKNEKVVKDIFLKKKQSINSMQSEKCCSCFTFYFSLSPAPARSLGLSLS